MSGTGEQAERIASEATDVRERVRRLVSKSATEGRKTISELVDETREILRGAGEGGKDAAPDQKREVLSEVVEGVSDALQQAAQHRGDVADARKRHARFDRVAADEAFRDAHQRRCC